MVTVTPSGQMKKVVTHNAITATTTTTITIRSRFKASVADATSTKLNNTKDNLAISPSFFLLFILF